MRDEMANLAWAIERTIESTYRAPATRATEAAPKQDSRRRHGPPTANGAAAAISVSDDRPAHWIPLLPVQLEHIGPPRTLPQRLKRGAVLQPDGTQRSTAHKAASSTSVATR